MRMAASSSGKRKQSNSATARAMLRATRKLVREVEALGLERHVAAVYNPLVYAAHTHTLYLPRFAATPKRVLFLGMNPGPFGMAQTGVPFGEIASVRDWMKIEGPVKQPPAPHPKRPIQGFECTRKEVSGQRLWGLFRERFGTAARFFRGHFVANYCPLVFMTETGANLTPDKLPAAERARLFAVCDAHLREAIRILQPRFLIGVGRFAEQRAKLALVAESNGIQVEKQPEILTILHPSPASPAANRDWNGTATRQLREAGVWKE